MRASAILLLALSLAGCGVADSLKPVDKDAECKAFLKVARAELREAKAPAAIGSSEKSTMEQRADRYRKYAAELEKIEIRDPDLKKAVGEYIAHVKGSAALFDELKGKDLMEALEKVDERDEAGNVLTKKINATCGATNP